MNPNIQQLEEITTRTYSNGVHVFGVEKTQYTDSPNGATFRVWTSEDKDQLMVPSEVPEYIVSRNDLIEIIHDMLN